MAMAGAFILLLLLWLERERGVSGAFVYSIGGALLIYIGAEWLRFMSKHRASPVTAP